MSSTGASNSGSLLDAHLTVQLLCVCDRVFYVDSDTQSTNKDTGAAVVSAGGAGIEVSAGRTCPVLAKPQCVANQREYTPDKHHSST